VRCSYLPSIDKGLEDILLKVSMTAAIRGGKKEGEKGMAGSVRSIMLVTHVVLENQREFG